MAKQADGFKIEGTINGITFYKSGGKYYARLKSRLSKKQVMTQPRFDRTRRNMAEFGKAAKANKMIRDAFRPYSSLYNSSMIVSRLTRALMAIVLTDDTSEHGSRNVQDGNISLLKGFEFNDHAGFSNVLKVDYTTSINRSSGSVWIDIGSYDASTCVKAPEGATHFRITLAAGEFDFENKYFNRQVTSTMELALNSTVAPMRLCLSLKPDSNYVIILAVALEFFQLRAGSYEQIGISDQPMTIADISAPES
jgi:hypothetical protein